MLRVVLEGSDAAFVVRPRCQFRTRRGCMPLEIVTIVGGPIQTNAYLVADTEPGMRW